MRRAREVSPCSIETGTNLFDAGNVYSDGTSEEIVGRALKDFARRDEVVIATKVNGRMRPGPNDAGFGRKAIMAEIDSSLRRLGTDYVDPTRSTALTPTCRFRETFEALQDVVKAGKARHIAASSTSAWQFATMLHVADANGRPPATAACIGEG